MYTYPWYHWLTFFYLYCFFGWIFESTYVSLRQKKFVNRGFLRLPMLPLYGTGAVMMLWLSLPVQDNIFLVYLSGVVGATALEYVTGWAMERLFKMKYWDYSNQKIQLNGYICLSSSIAWGFLTIFLTDVIHRPIARFVLDLPLILEVPLISVVSVLFVADTIWSVKEALDLRRVLESMENIKEELESLGLSLREEAVAKAELLHDSARLRAAGVAEKAVFAAAGIAERAEVLESRIAERAEAVESRIAERNAARAEVLETWIAEGIAQWEQQEEALSKHIRSLFERRHQLSHRLSSYQRRILRGNPTASSKRYAEALQELRDILDEHRKNL